ncbi:anthranilate phosphoribosyltransferase [Fimbriimonas ginsengisoli]|uniref:Anthranilate phosphoribosyltransferase n=1 Tax=Fimbriimonas ginsengisoli Gsoil 348 TaxID=661478 RepID=A0A068NZ67_FIMGI|nr:anthranilate phosphoribosyltransferase [Fimbriimonas ginsengisoli]AIE88044.1 Anthranilate phosphoribosyltransferase [Fimbriimonas ginsengisoli Gsoil 348]
MSFPDLVQPLIERKDLDPEMAEELMRYLISGEATEAQIGAVLFGLRMKGCTTREIASFVRVMREKAASVTHSHRDLVDTCGTGGGVPTFNISTAAAVVACAAGVRIAKHGNRSISGMGSADVLETLGAQLSADPERLAHMLETVRLVFLFAPAHHPAMRHVAAARKQLGFRTVFNQLGPLSNPAQAQRQLIGVYDAGLMRSMGEALRELGTERALIVHGNDGLDELSPCEPSEYVKVWDGKVSTGTLTPESFGLEPMPRSAVAPGRDLDDCAGIFREAVGDAESPRAGAVIPSAAATIWLAGLEDDLPSAARRAKLAIANGLATAKLQEIIEFGGRL